MRDDPVQKGYDSYTEGINNSNQITKASVLTDLLKIIKYRNTWILSIVSACLIGPVLTFAGLWGIPYLTTQYNLTPVKSATLISTLLISCSIGAPVLGALSEKMGRRKTIYFYAQCISLVGWIPILYLHDISLWLLIVLFSIVGFASGAIVIGMAFVKESVPLGLAGTVSGISNMGMEMGPMILQPTIGLLLDRRWEGLLENGVRIYNLSAYHVAFGAIIGLSILGPLLTAFAQETFCRHLDE
jgi:MFS family permease